MSGFVRTTLTGTGTRYTRCLLLLAKYLIYLTFIGIITTSVQYFDSSIHYVLKRQLRHVAGWIRPSTPVPHIENFGLSTEPEQILQVLSSTTLFMPPHPQHQQNSHTCTQPILTVVLSLFIDTEILARISKALDYFVHIQYRSRLWIDHFVSFYSSCASQCEFDENAASSPSADSFS